MGEAQSRSVMLQHQDQPLDHGSSPSSSLRNRKDGNFNFLPGKDDDGYTGSTGGGGGGGDENRNQVRPRSLGPLGRDPPGSSPSYHQNNAQRGRAPCWRALEPLPEIDSAEDGYGRVPPDGAEERRMEEEEGGGAKQLQKRKSSSGLKGQEGKGGGGGGGGGGRELEDSDEWGDSDSGSDCSYRSGSSMSSLHLEGGGANGTLMGGWDRIGVGEPRPSLTEQEAQHARHNSFSRARGGKEEEEEEEEQSSDSDGQPAELMDAVWTLRDRERFKAQEMEKHQVQLTMYRRLALIRWVRTLQGRVTEQQNRLQSSFDVILTHRKELLRMGAAASTAVAVVAPPPAAAVGQS